MFVLQSPDCFLPKGLPNYSTRIQTLCMFPFLSWKRKQMMPLFKLLLVHKQYKEEHTRSNEESKITYGDKTGASFTGYGCLFKSSVIKWCFKEQAFSAVEEAHGNFWHGDLWQKKSRTAPLKENLGNVMLAAAQRTHLHHTSLSLGREGNRGGFWVTTALSPRA